MNYDQVKGIFQKIIKSDKKGKDQTLTHEILSKRISQKMMDELTSNPDYQKNRIIVRCIVTDSSDQVVAYSLSKNDDLGNACVLRAIDNSFSYICFVCII